MEAPLKQYPPWNSLPTTFSRSQTASSLRDSSCASDDVSDISLGTINTTLTNISSTLPDFGIPIPHTPKLHFKFQNSVHTLSGTDFGYESDDSRVEGTEHVEFSEHDYQYPENSLQGDEIFAFEDYSYDPLENATSPYDPCDSTSEFDDFEDFEDIDEDFDGYTDDLQFDDSHIAFENVVRFDPDVSYIEAVELPDVDANEGSETPQMTLHELMLLADRQRGLVGNDSKGDNEEDDMNAETSIANGLIEELAQDHPRDVMDVDRQLFIAFINGLHGDTGRKYQPRLQDRVQGFREGRFQSPFFEGEKDSSGCFMLDEALKHVIGMFRHVVLREEFDELVHLAQSSRMQKEMSAASPHMQPSSFWDKIEGLLSERLLKGIASVGKDELSFFADGVVYALERPKIYTYDGIIAKGVENLKAMGENKVVELAALLIEGSDLVAGSGDQQNRYLTTQQWSHERRRKVM
ncbi:conserved hypothetical protein [Talaromyces stipitatus ATCC 10500]|uniref:Uncharacterized protein n=1 Tax=Talaromyces stipitatus (strain ATCC 10500 / CBS 375.48 / QM 6759 / NRRL 1006) TaxID=441959 RepID=B8MBI2_TALSN|nr:uncharacterized protein TSTA_116360 [Talaromyces stipitatus ATCC 10500]EED17846.1 conserved hypothetical protein [Talaromyces stipitatus ATCC 10500]